MVGSKLPDVPIACESEDLHVLGSIEAIPTAKMVSFLNKSKNKKPVSAARTMAMMTMNMTTIDGIGSS